VYFFEYDADKTASQQLEDHERLKHKASNCGLNLYTYNEVIDAGSKYEGPRPDEPTADTIYMLSYTSGTTGNPKAAKLSHGNFVAAATASKYGGITPEITDVAMSWLPLAHCFEQVLFCMCIIAGVKIGYYSGDVLKIAEDCVALKPTMFPGVPRIYNRIYDIIRGKLAELTPVRSYVAHKAISSKLYYLEHNNTVEHYAYDTVVFSKFKAFLGGNIRMMLTGASPISEEVINFLKVCFCCPIIEGYGQTESSAASCATMPFDPVAGHVGGPLAGVKVRLRDLPEMNYMSTDKPNPRGEICFKGPTVFKGYFKNAEKTKEALSE
jgi:long-chain acyl-CoA synthetase